MVLLLNVKSALRKKKMLLYFDQREDRMEFNTNVKPALEKWSSMDGITNVNPALEKWDRGGPEIWNER